MACNQSGNLIECHTCIHMLAMLNVVACPSIMRTDELCGDAQPAKKMVKHNARTQNTKPRKKKNNGQQKRTRQNITTKKNRKKTGRVDGVPKYVTPLIENDLRSTRANSKSTPGWTLRQNGNMKNTEPSPRTGITIPGSKMPKNVRPRTDNSVGM